MKKIIFFSFFLLFIACDDGDLQIETIDFDDISIQMCDPVSADDSNLLFKINDAEALILELQDGAITNVVSEDGEPTSFDLSASSTTRLTYRTFSGTITSDYFCNDIPVVDPSVVEEIVAGGGQLLITTTINENDGDDTLTTYIHTIQLSNISFLTSENVRITNLAVNNFGTVSTTEAVVEETVEGEDTQG